MEIDVIQLIGQLGFPIAICLGSMFFIYKIYWANREDSMKREEKCYNLLASFQSALTGFEKVLEKYNDKLNVISQDVDEIKKTISK